jgi:4-amino-4-deoxy-L-arabinose transferase-like glycosyltransferase
MITDMPQQSKNLKKSFSLSQQLFWLCFAVILGVACLVRFVKLGSVPYSLYWDESAMFVDVKSVLQTGKDMHGRPWFEVIYPSYGDYKLPVYIWFATATSKVFGLSEWSLRLPSALAGIGTVIIAGLLAREFWSEKEQSSKQMLQLLTMLVVAITPWSMMFSRTAFEGHLGQFLLGCSILCLFASRKSQKQKWLLFLSPILGALATYTYFSVRFVWLAVFGLSVLVLLFEKWHGKKIEWKLLSKEFAVQLIIPVGIFAVLLLPMLKSPLYADSNRFRLGTDSVLKNDQQIVQSNIYREMAGNSVVDRVVFHRLWLTIQELMKNYSDNISFNFLFLSGDQNLRHGTGQYGLFLLIFLPFFLWGWYSFFQKRKDLCFLLFVWWIVALLPASVPENTPHALRSLNALIPLAIVIGTGMTEFIEWVLSLNSQLVKRSVLATFAFILTLSSFTFFYHYFTIYPKESAADWQDGYKQLAQTIYQHKQAGQIVYIQEFDDRFYLWLMGYGPFSGKDFQSWKSKDYKFAEAIPEVKFGGYQLSNLPANATWYATSAENFKSQSNAKVSQTYEVKGGDNTVRFVLVELKK